MAGKRGLKTVNSHTTQRIFVYCGRGSSYGNEKGIMGFLVRKMTKRVGDEMSDRQTERQVDGWMDGWTERQEAMRWSYHYVSVIEILSV